MTTDAIPAAARAGSGKRPISDFEVVLVSYRSRHHVEELLRSWPSDLSVAVVDNSANVDGIVELAAGLPNVRQLSGGGQGFGRAANLGAFTSEKPYVVFVNPDCRPTIEQLISLVDGVAADETAVCHAATPISPDGVIEIGVGGWEPSVRRTLVHAAGLHFLFPLLGLFSRPQLHERVNVDWVTGTCMAVRRVPFVELGGFDEAFFVYCEDVAFGHRARQHGWRTVLREDILVPHGAGSSGAPSAEMRRLQGASFAVYTDRYSGPAPRAAAIRTIYVLGFAWRLALHTVAGRRDHAAAARAIIKGVITRKAFVNGVEVARARAAEVGPAA
jgi:GT2 family glycosyltransferase